ncbi:hypothetical protein AAG068_17220 [Bacillus paramycoides]
MKFYELKMVGDRKGFNDMLFTDEKGKGFLKKISGRTLNNL